MSRSESAAAPQSSTLCLRNVIPRRFLTPRWTSAHAAVLFSATLSPPEFHLDMLGLPPESRRIDVQSPFKAEQLTYASCAPSRPAGATGPHPSSPSHT